MSTPVSHQNPHQISMTLMAAIAHAERVAQDNPEHGAAIYKAAITEPSMPHPRIYVRRGNDAPPEGADLIVHVRRRGLDAPADLSLMGAIRLVLDNLPDGITLNPELIIEHYPTRTPHAPRELFAVQFLSTEGLNVATWIPDVKSGITMQPGPAGRGRLFGNAMNPGTRNIAGLLAQIIEERAAAGQSAEPIKKTPRP